MDFDAARRAAEAYDPVKWREEIQRAYGPAAPGVIEMEEEAGKNASAGRLARIDTMERRWSEISALLRTLPTSDYVADLLSGLGRLPAGGNWHRPEAVEGYIPLLQRNKG